MKWKLQDQAIIALYLEEILHIAVLFDVQALGKIRP